MKLITFARDKITDPKVLNTYDKYKKYLSELAIYEEYMQDYGLDKINKFKLKMLYKKSGLEKKKGRDLEYDFRRFGSIIGVLKQKYPDLDLKDISTKRGRTAVSDAIYKTQGEYDIKAADLDAVAIVEKFALYAAVGLVNEGKENKPNALAKYDISEAEFNRAAVSLKKYERSGIMEDFNRRCMRISKDGKTTNPPDAIIHYAAGTLEISPAEAMEDLFMLKILNRADYIIKQPEGEKGEDKSFDPIEPKKRVVYGVSQLVIDNIRRDPKLTEQEKIDKIRRLEEEERKKVMEKIDEANKKQGAKRFVAVKEDDDREVG